jgi:transposase
MPRYKPVELNPRFIPVVLEEQILPGTFEFALNHLVDNELDLTRLDAKFKNDITGASAYDPRVMLKIILLAYSRGILSSREIADACKKNVLFMAISGDSEPCFAHIAKFVRELNVDIQPLFKQLLMICDRMGLIGKELFAIDGVKLPSNASKERSGTHAELLHRAGRLEKAANRILELHQQQDKMQQQPTLSDKRQAQVEALRKQAQLTREFVAKTKPKLNAHGKELKSNITDNDSAKMATSKGVIQGYAGQAVVDNKHQIIVAAEVLGSGSEQAALLPMIEQTQDLRTDNTIITADAGYHSKANLEELKKKSIPAFIADNQMRKRDERFADQDKYKADPDPLHNKQSDSQTSKVYRPEHFEFNSDHTQCICPANQILTGNGKQYITANKKHYKFQGTKETCGACSHRQQCLRKPEKTPYRQVSYFIPKGQNQDPNAPETAIDLMIRAIDSPQGRMIYSQRIGTVEPVFANLRYNKGCDRFMLRGRDKVNTQWQLYCMVHNIEKMSQRVPH